jgi:hypothetical protein
MYNHALQQMYINDELIYVQQKHIICQTHKPNQEHPHVNMPKTIVFDIVGTLVSHEHFYTTIEQRLGAQLLPHSLSILTQSTFDNH